MNGLGSVQIGIYRTVVWLRRANINTVADLINKTGEDMMKVRNMGKKSLDEVQKKLEMMGLSLASEDSGSNN